MDPANVNSPVVPIVPATNVQAVPKTKTSPKPAKIKNTDKQQAEDGKFMTRLGLKLGLIQKEDTTWYKPFKRVKKRKIRKFKILVIAMYLLIAFGSIILHPYLMMVLTNGFRPTFRQPGFAHAFDHYVYLIKFAAGHRYQRPSKEIINLSKPFDEMISTNNKILYLLLLVLPTNVFFTLCLAFRFTRQKLTVAMIVAHFVLALINGGLAGGVYFIYISLKNHESQILHRGVDSITHIETEWLKFSEDYRLKTDIKEFTPMMTYLIPVFAILATTFFLHFLLGIFFIVRKEVTSIKGVNENGEVKAK